MKKKKFLLLLPLLIVAVIIVYSYVSAIEENETYYFPQIEMYIKIHKPPFDKYGYVYFSRDSVFSLSGKEDFVKIYRSETNSVSFIFNPAENDVFYFVDDWNNVQTSQVNLTMKKITREDTDFFDHLFIANMCCAQTLKMIYFEITVEGYSQSLFYIDRSGGKEYPVKAEPMK